MGEVLRRCVVPACSAVARGMRRLCARGRRRLFGSARQDGDLRETSTRRVGRGRHRAAGGCPTDCRRGRAICARDTCPTGGIGARFRSPAATPLLYARCSDRKSPAELWSASRPGGWSSGRACSFAGGRRRASAHGLPPLQRPRLAPTQSTGGRDAGTTGSRRAQEGVRRFAGSRSGSRFSVLGWHLAATGSMQAAANSDLI